METVRRGSMPRGSMRRRLRGACALLLLAAPLTGCSATGNLLFPTKAALPADMDTAYDELKDAPDDTVPSEPTRLYLRSFDPEAAKPNLPTRPVAPVLSARAGEKFALTPLGMTTRPPDATACQAIVDAVGGGHARCAPSSDPDLGGERPADVPAGSYVVGRSFADGRMVLLDQPGKGGLMWDAAMHERGHLYEAWLCGRMDCLDSTLILRGYPANSSYLASLPEGFAQSWAQCNGAHARPDYRQIGCGDITAVVTTAMTEKAQVKAQYEADKKSYDAALSAYGDQMRDYDHKTSEVRLLGRFADAEKARPAAS